MERRRGPGEAQSDTVHQEIEWQEWFQVCDVTASPLMVNYDSNIWIY